MKKRRPVPTGSTRLPTLPGSRHVAEHLFEGKSVARTSGIRLHLHLARPPCEAWEKGNMLPFRRKNKRSDEEAGQEREGQTAFSAWAISDLKRSLRRKGKLGKAASPYRRVNFCLATPPSGKASFAAGGSAETGNAPRMVLPCGAFPAMAQMWPVPIFSRRSANRRWRRFVPR